MLSLVDAADSGVFERSKKFVKLLAGIFVISFRIKTGNRRDQNQLFLDSLKQGMEHKSFKTTCSSTPRNSERHKS